MHQVAEFSAAEWVVAEILDDRAAVSIGVRLFDLVFRESGNRLSRRGRISIGPEQVDDFLVRQNGICGQAAVAHEHDKQKC